MEQYLKPMELSFPLPKAPHIMLHVHLTFLTTSTMLFLTTATIGETTSSVAPMGSFVYAMSDVCLLVTTILFHTYSLPQGYTDMVTAYQRIKRY